MQCAPMPTPGAVASGVGRLQARPAAGWSSSRPCVHAAAAAAAPPRAGGACVVKICGITNAEDATTAAKAGADYVGLIMWQKAKRSVPEATARLIVDAARAGGAQPVGVFVDESAEDIAARCAAVGLRVAQLHGDGARAALQGLRQLDAGLQLVYVMHATPEGHIVTPPPPPGEVEWVLVDGLKGGSGEALDWSHLEPPAGLARRGWLLAGGLTPSNVAQAIRTARPGGVDTSSGVCGPDGLQKDVDKIMGFVAGAAIQAGP